MTKHFIALIASTFLLTACQTGSLFKPSLYDETLVTQRNIELHEDRFVDKLSAKDINFGYLEKIASAYGHQATSPLYVLLGYNPNQKTARLSAFNKSNIIKGQLAKLGVKDTVIKITPILDSNGEAVIAYDQIHAKGPSDCGKIPGYDTETGAYGDYGLGCTVKDMMAKQVAYPADLEGTGSMDSDYGASRAAVIVTRDVQSGEVSDFVPSYVLSELAGNTTN